MLLFFLNPGFLFIAGALVSVPIIIHLINRMRFKRIRWAAMEFLLKAQKRTRRRLIIEQLILLALRCLLIALVGLLVSRFIGCGDANFGGKPNLHVALLDDTVSMRDGGWKNPDGSPKNCFEVATMDFLLKKIAKGMGQSKTNDRLIVLPLSKVNEPDFDIKDYTFERLNDPQQLDALDKKLKLLQPSMMHVNMQVGVKKVEEIIGNFAESRVNLHILGDYRHKDWAQGGNGLTKTLVDLAVKRSGDLKIRAIDTAFPPRGSGQGGYPPSHDNVGIVDIRPSTRIAGKSMPVMFTVSIRNFSGKQVECRPVVRNENTGMDMRDIDFHVSDPNKINGQVIKLDPDAVTTTTFEYKFSPILKPTEPYFAHLSVRLTNPQLGPLDNDGILADNERHTVVEVRDKVPVLVIDGERIKPREEGKDSFHIERSMYSMPGASYYVVFGDELPGCTGDSVKALERPDLHLYPTIFMLNVPSLNPNTKQLKNLENYVKDGGGVAFFLGPLVNAGYYNKWLYNEGNGIFPAPLKDPYYPPPSAPPLEPQSGDTYQLITRDEKWPDARLVPIFGAIFEEPAHREPLRGLPIRRYFQVNRAHWKQEPGRVFELATLPNDKLATDHDKSVESITRGDTAKKILESPEFAKYRSRFREHLDELERLATPGSEARAFHLADRIDALLSDKGNPQVKGGPPDLTELWASSDAKVVSLKAELVTLREEVRYGDPFIVTQSFGKGKVVAVMSTAGKGWNDFGGGSLASILYMPFIRETQNYLSSSGGEANLTVGSTLNLTLEAEQFKGKEPRLNRYVVRTEEGKPSRKGDPAKVAPANDKDGLIVFTLAKHHEPGLYLYELIDESDPGRPLAVYGYTFNIDTEREGPLQRVGSDELDRELFKKEHADIKLVAPGALDGDLVSRQNDFSESPWLFLLFLLVLVAEQALAVHLSFHMRPDDQGVMPAGVKV